VAPPGVVATPMFTKSEPGDLGIQVAPCQAVASSNNSHVLDIIARGFRNSSGPSSARAWQQQLQCSLKQSHGIGEFKWSLFRPCIATTTLLFTNSEPGIWEFKWPLLGPWQLQCSLNQSQEIWEFKWPPSGRG
jgi:hypothetical protein